MRMIRVTGWAILLSGVSGVSLVAQDAMVVAGVSGGSALPPGVSAPAPVIVAPAAASVPAPAPAYAAPPPAPRSAPQPPVGLSAPAWTAPSAGVQMSASSDLAGWAPETLSGQSYQREPIPGESRGYYPGRDDKGAGLRGRAPAQAPANAMSSSYRMAQVSGGSSLPPGVGPGGTTQPPQPVTGQPVPPQYPPQTQPRSWSQKLGLGNISTKVFGHLRGGVGARDLETIGEDGWEETYALDGYVGGELSALTPSGIEYGVALGLRGAAGPDGTLFGGAIGDCPTGPLGCPGQISFAGQSLALRGHTSQLFTGAMVDEDEARLVLETAHAFVRTPYGDVSVGRDVGAGELFSLATPSLLALSLNSNRADYTGLGMATTTNDPTGYSEKITYTSPRLGGEIVGLSAQVGASYTPDVDACGVYSCIRRNGDDLAGGSIGATLEDAWEIAASFERSFGEVKGEFTGTYARANVEQSLAAFDDLESWNIGARLNWRNVSLGGSYLESNNALADGDYTAWDAGLTYEHGPWGATLGYAHAKDDNVAAQSDQYLVGLTRNLGRIKIGTGLQYIERTSPVLNGTLLDERKEKATAIFVETGWEF